MSSTQRKQVLSPATYTYHIVWTTYGTWLHGDDRGWYKWGRGAVGEADPSLEEAARRRMAGPAVVLSAEQREIVAGTIRSHCEIRGSRLHAVQALPNHVHAVVTADLSADEVAHQFKAWCSRKLSDASALVGTVTQRAGRGRWFTEGSGKRTIENDEYLLNAIHYVTEGQARSANK